MALDGSMGYHNLSEKRAHELCNFTTEEWNARSFGSLHKCMQNMDYHQWLTLEAVGHGFMLTDETVYTE